MERGRELYIREGKGRSEKRRMEGKYEHDGRGDRNGRTRIKENVFGQRKENMEEREREE